MNTTGYCCSAGRANTIDYSSSFSIHIETHDKIIKPTCSISLSDNVQSTINLRCSWRKEYFGINSTIMMAGLGSGRYADCSDTHAGQLEMKNLSPWDFFQYHSEANCSLQIPNNNIDNQPSCNYSKRIIPKMSSIHVGESVNLTCPQNSSLLKWKEFTPNGIFGLDGSGSTLSYNATNVYEHGLIIMCTVQSDNGELVLGIGKIIVQQKTKGLSESKASTCETTTDINYSSEYDSGTSITSKLYELFIIITTFLSVAVLVCISFIFYLCKKISCKLCPNTPQEHHVHVFHHQYVPSENSNIPATQNFLSTNAVLDETIVRHDSTKGPHHYHVIHNT